MDEQRRRTAYHEAGHAVTSYAKGIPMDSASILEEGISLGRVISYREPEAGAAQRGPLGAPRIAPKRLGGIG